MAQSNNFGAFLTGLAKDNTVAASTLDSIREKMEKERQAKIEQKLRLEFNQIQSHVQEIRSLKRRIEVHKGYIKAAEQRANDIVAGKDE